MSDKKDLVSKLPGSARGDRDSAGVTNHVLMPKANKLPGHKPPETKSASVPPPELLGSGSKIPESYQSRMKSQFSMPDPAKFRAKKRPEAPSASPEDNWWSNEVRTTPIGMTPYKTASAAVPQNSGASKSESSFAAKARAEKAAQKAAQEKAAIDSEHKRLRGQKEAMLSALCSNPNMHGTSTEAYRVVNIVMDINRRLGLSSTDMGKWKLPD